MPGCEPGTAAGINDTTLAELVAVLNRPGVSGGTLL